MFVVYIALYSYTYFLSTEFAFRIVNAPMALDLAFGIVCELLQQWGEIHAGVPVLLEWLLGDSDLQRDGETSAQVILTSSCYSMLEALQVCGVVVGIEQNVSSDET